MSRDDLPAVCMPGTHVRTLNGLCEIAGITPVVLGPQGQQRLAPIRERVSQ